MGKNKEIRTEEERKKQSKQILDILFIITSIIGIVICKSAKFQVGFWLFLISLAISFIHLKMIGRKR